ncbi:MAG: aspartate aminotransferase family protein [Saprospiraceae bacterium]|nr:aspartate aminotransferase family protein [Saprospiraceae bacterium]
MPRDSKAEKTIQEKMFQEMKTRNIFDQAHHYVYSYLDQVFERNVFPTEEAITDLRIFDEEMPIEDSDAEAVIYLLHRYGNPATVASLGGRYFGFVTGSVVPVGLATKSLSTYWDQVSAMYVISPLASKLESVVEKWLVDLFNLPTGTSAGFVSGTSSANLCGLAAARYRLLWKQNWDVNEKGLFGAPKIRIVTGQHAHSAVLKAVAILGLGKANIEFVDVDNQGRINVDEIPDLDENTIVILQAGNVNSGAFDDFEPIIKHARSTGAWVHIDGAFGLWAAAVDSHKHLTAGIENADSWAVDAHKTLNTPYDSGIILCRDSEALSSALHMSAGYIIESHERDGMFYTPEMSRRARIIELWSIMKYLGRDGIDQMISIMVERARQFAQEIRAVEGFSVENDVVFNQVVIRYQDDELTNQVLQKVQDLRECWAGGSTWFGKKVIRVSVCSWATTSEDITRSVNSFKQAILSINRK